MQTDNYVISLDVGTQYIKASALSIYDQTVIYGTLEQSNGITKEGRISPKELGEAIRAVINKLELKIERKIQSSYVCIPSEFTRLMPTEGHSLILNEVTQRELDEAMESAQRVFHGSNEEVVDLIIAKYLVDETQYGNPCGVKGQRLSLFGQAVLGEKDFLNGLYEAMANASLKISGIGLATEGAASLLLTKTDLREGVILVDTGASSTRIAFYRNQTMEKFQWIKLGGKSITKDISIVMKKTLLEAEEMKIAYGKGERNLSEEDTALLEEIVKARITEIMSFVENFVREIEEFSPEKVICYGGGLCGFLNIVNLYKTNLKQSTNFMTSDIIRDDTVLHIQSGGVAYRLLSSTSCLASKNLFTNLVEREQEDSTDIASTSESNGNQNKPELQTHIKHDEHNMNAPKELAENKFIAWIKSIMKKIKNI